MYSRQKLEQWLSSASRASLKEAVLNQVSSETQERVLRNSDSYIDYGYSFPGLNSLKQTCLKEVRDYYEATGKRARVADIGAGFGTMTWKLLAAGAEVDAFEIQKPTANELSRRIKNMNPYFWNEDNVENILHIFPENALSVLTNPDFTEKYDFIWTSQVMHFFTPDEMQKLNVIFQQVLKPGGKVFAEANGRYTFQKIDTQAILQTCYDNANKKGVAFPGFITFNTATLIDQSINKVVDISIVSAYDQTEMEKYSIPYQTNSYGSGYLGPAQEDAVETRFNDIRKQYPDHRFRINRFHQVLNLLDEITATLCFHQAGFECTSYFYNPWTGSKLSAPVDISEDSYIAVYLQKSPEFLPQVKCSPLITHTIFNEPPHNQLILDVENNCKGKVAYVSFLEAIHNKEYSLALRKACAVGNLVLVKTILKYKQNLDIDINEPSIKNGFTALDWINTAKKIDSLTQERVISLLLGNGAKSGRSEEAQLPELRDAEQLK